MAFCKSSYKQSLSQQLLDEIIHQRSREINQITREDSGFVFLNTTTVWADLFKHFLCYCDDNMQDDLLFFVRKHPKNIVARYIPQFETAIEVFRKDSRKLPIDDPEIDWEETVYLNLILQQFEYTLTCAVCTRTSPKDFQVLKRNSQKVFASPSHRSMDSKGETEEISYPNIFFTVDNFDEVFEDILVRDGEMVCVELVAADKEGDLQCVIFLGSIHYDAVKRVYDARASLSSRFAQRVSLGWYQGNQRLEFVRMRGPKGKGHAEMAVTKQKGSGVETPTSEPGYSLTDIDWEDMDENPYLQRRMSDPSSNLNTYVRSWKTKQENRKSQSETELNYYSNGITEIEAGDIRDEFCRKRIKGTKHRKHKSMDAKSDKTSMNQCLNKTKSEAKTKLPLPSKQSRPLPKTEKEMDVSLDELDDPTYNRLWRLRGFNQAYHFWKESRRASSPALHAYLTYVTLPWNSIITDLLHSRQEPILTF